MKQLEYSERNENSCPAGFPITLADEKNRTWLASIENHSQIRPTGVRGIWVDGGDLTTPAYEYDIKAGVYGNVRLRWGNYIDMSKNYLSKIRKTAN